MALKPISFVNDLAYDVIVYDSSNPDDPTAAENTYLGELVSLGTITAKSSTDITPLQPGSAFVIENAKVYKPVKRYTVPAISHVTSVTVAQTDEDAMTAALNFANFTMHNKSDAMSQAFDAVINGNNDDLATAVTNFFKQYPAYQLCDFQTYMMAVAYVALNPESIAKPPQNALYSLSKLVNCLGGKYPDGFPDVAVSNFNCSTKNNTLDLKMDIDLGLLSFESAVIKENIVTLFPKKTVKVELTCNFSFGLGIFGTRLTLDLDDFKIPVGNSKDINVTKPMITIDINPLFKFAVLTVRGIIPFNMFSKAFDANISMTIDNVEAAIGVVIEGDKTSFPSPPGLKGVHFDEFGVGMGVFFKPPSFALGIQGKYHIGEPTGPNVIDLNDDTFVIVCTIEEEIPVPVYASFYIPKMDANKALELFTNTSPNIDVPVEFSDMSFRWAADPMEPIVLPDGTLSEMAYGFSAAINILSFGFYGEVAIDLSNGLTANVTMSPMNWNNIFKMSGDGKGVTIKVDKDGNPIRNNEIRDQQVLKDALATATDKQIVTPGGPVLLINTFKAPILHINGKVSLFDLADYAIEADINKDGIKFMLDYGIVLKEKMSVTLSDFHNLAASFTYYINQSITVPTVAGVRLGSFKLSADVSTHFSITTSLSNIVIAVGGNFDFEGLHRSFGDFSGDINISKITDFLISIGKYIEQKAKDIFSDFLGDAQAWANKVKSGFLTGCDEVGTVLKNAWNADSIAVANIMKKAGYLANDISKNIKDAWNCGVNDVTYAMKAVGYAAEDISNSLKNTFTTSAQEVTNALKAMGFSPDDIAKNLKDTWSADSIAVADIMKKAGYVAGDVAKGIKDAWNCGVNDVTYAMHAVGYAANDVASGLQSAFNAGAQDVTNSFKWIGYAANDVGGSLKNIYNQSANQVASLMKNAGYAAQDVANTLKSAFNSSIDDAASALKYAGYAETEVASSLQSAFNTSVSAVATAMKDVGYAANTVADAFKSLGGDFASFASSTWDKITDKDTWNPSKW